jgi:hypothetical protein
VAVLGQWRDSDRNEDVAVALNLYNSEHLTPRTLMNAAPRLTQN